jgi:DNA adenine methylase
LTRELLEPVIKWSGSKRRLVPVLKPLIKGIGFGRYFEPFLGGGSVLGSLGPLPSTASDLQPELIALWKLIQSDPESLAAQYSIHWNNLQENGHTYYYEVRDHFNTTRSPESFLFLTRTCVNGLIRFNTAGDFNNSLHHTRPGIAPDRLGRILKQWSELVSDTVFLNADYEQATSKAVSGDLV